MTTVSAFWGDHEISREDAALVVSRTLTRIAQIDPLLSGWRDKGRSKKSAMRAAEMDLSAESLTSKLAVNRTDAGHEVIPSLGFSLSGWNGQPGYEDQASFSVTIGLHAAHPSLRNSCVLQLPRAWAQADGRIDTLVLAMADELRPDEIVAFDSDADGALRRRVIWTRD